MNRAFFKREYVHAGILIFGFLAVSAFAAKFVQLLPADTLLRSGLGMAVYMSIVAINAVIIVPISSVPLIPLASELWGPIVTALLSSIGWTVGALLAFVIGRYLGREIVNKMAPGIAERIARRVEKGHLFWNVVLLRMIMPVDVLSYVLGSFTSMRLFPYMLATSLGVFPFSFVFSYGSTLPFTTQLIGVFIVIAVIFHLNYSLLKDHQI